MSQTTRLDALVWFHPVQRGLEGHTQPPRPGGRRISVTDRDAAALLARAAHSVETETNEFDHAETTSALLIESTRSPLSSPAASAIPSRCSRETSAPGEGQAQSQGDGQDQG